MHNIATRDLSLAHHSSTTGAKKWTQDTHSTRISGAVWFKHKYLTTLSVTSKDQIVAAIGGLAKTITTKITPQLQNKTIAIDKLCNLQDILQLSPKKETKMYQYSLKSEMSQYRR
jgi:hypothetical protein